MVALWLGVMLAKAVAQNHDACRNSSNKFSPDDQIAACTATIGKGLPVRELALAFYYRGKGYGLKSDNDNAIDDFTKALERDATLLEAYTARGFLYNLRGEFAKAIADYDKAIEIAPKNAYAFAYRGYAYYSSGKLDSAIDNYSAAIRLDSNLAIAYVYRGYVFRLKKEYKTAINDYWKGLEIGTKTNLPADDRRYALKGILEAARRHGSPVLLDDGTEIEALRWINNWFVHAIRMNGSIELRGITTNVNISDNVRRFGNIDMLLYSCGNQRGEPNLARLDVLAATSRYTEAVLELRKDCSNTNGQSWLATKSKEGYAPFVMEYADWQRRIGDANATYSYALGFMRFLEDATLCEDTSGINNPGNIYEELTQNLASVSASDRLELLRRAAKESEKVGVVGEPSYACFGAGNSLKSEEISSQNLRPEAAWEGLRAKVRAELISSVGLSARNSVPSESKPAPPESHAAGKQIAALSHQEAVHAAVFSQRGNLLVTASGNTAQLWDPETGRQIAILRGHDGSVSSAKFSPDGKLVVTASRDTTARLWDADTGKGVAILRGHEKGLRTASFSPDGLRVVTASLDGAARIWQTRDGKELAILKGHSSQLETATFSPDGTHIITGSFDGTARLWNSATGKEIRTLPAGWAEVATFSPDGKRVLTLSGWDFTPKLWDTASGKELAVLRANDQGTLRAAFSRDARRIVTGSMDGTARIWDTNSGRQILTLHGHTAPIYSATFSSDGQRVITGSCDKTAILWDASTGKEIEVFGPLENCVYTAEFSPDGRLAVTTSDKTARVWDISSKPNSPKQ